MVRSRLVLAGLLAPLVAVTGALVPVLTAPAASAAAVRTVTLVGSLQSELGCAADWQETCAKTDLTREGDSTTYSAEFAVPAGGYELKVAIDHSWDESYGAGGAKNGANIPLTLKGDAKLRVSYDDTTHKIGIAPTDLPGPATSADKALAGSSLREPLTRERFYFVMADRFANGDKANDTGGLTGGREQTGYDPTDKGFYHGGDLAGLTSKLDYIKGLGTTAIWLTPAFKNRPVQGTGSDASAGYHGYWITDFTKIDPHLGTNEDMKKLVDAAHRKGMKVFFDIITNHTADVIDYQGGQHSYVDKTAKPYLDAAGKAFDDKAFAGGDTFPELDASKTFPYTPTFRTDADKTVKVPAWLNDPTRYHNRGDSTYAGESTEYGDFSGLDDLWTEQPAVVNGMTDIYKKWVDFGIDGFRIDTVKHVNMEFWQKFSPAVMARAKADGKKDFFMFGEVYDGNPAFMSRYTTTGTLPATLDFGFQGSALGFAQGKATTNLRDFYAGDDYYTDTDSNAYELPTFLGNHDMGRIGMMLKSGGATGADLLDRAELANSLMFLTRGQPVVYYGDEQGFIGSGGDKDAREDLFATKVPQYAGEAVMTGTPGSKDRYDTTSPLYQQISRLSALRAANPALADGAQIHRYASDGAGIFAVSRVDARTGTEYLVVANNATTPKSASFDTYSDRMGFTPLYGSRSTLRSGRDGQVDVTVAPLSVSVWKARSGMARRKSAPAVYLTSPAAGGVVGGRAEIGAAVPEDAFAQVSFAYRPVGTTAWQRLGTDDNAPYRVFQDVSGVAKGTLLEYRAVARDISGNLSATSSYGIVGDPAPSGGGAGPVGPVTQPDAVSVPGTHNSEMGCAGDWQPDCAQAQLTLDAQDQIWKGTYSTIPAGSNDYKAAINKSWDENYGAGGAKGGSNITYTAPGGNVTFYYDHATHYVTSDAQGPIITAPGSYQSELGCAADWSPACMRPWLQDPDGDGTYTWSSDQIPAGSYEFKVAHGLSWDESYGDNGNNVALSVPSDGTVVTISYVLATHQISVKTSRAGSAPDLRKAKAIWVAKDLVAWPATSVPAGTDPRLARWRLHWSPTGGLAVDAEAVTGGSSASLQYDAAGLPAAVVAAHPELKGYLALRLPRATAGQAGEILRGQVAVGMYDTLGRLTDATGVQVAGVLDDLYARSATRDSYGVSWRGRSPSFSLWAPTAQAVSLLVWPSTASGSAPVSEATRVSMRRGTDGTWTAPGRVSWRGARYLYDVRVFAPTTGKVETNLVTDPYSVALTLDSTRSVAVDLDRRQPATRPVAAQPVAGAQAGRRLQHLRAARARLLDLRHERARGTPRFVPRVRRRRQRDQAPQGARRRGAQHRAPAPDLRHRLDRGGPGQAGEACLRPRVVRAGQPGAAEVRHGDRREGRLQLGLRPLPLDGAGGLVRLERQGRRRRSRVAEFRTMVGGLHRDGLRVVLDQVFNHTPASGQADTSVLDRIVPGYYQRLDASGAVQTSTCCQNVATEHAMGQKIMVDSVVSWARNYKVDGFRFDLMGHHSKANMLAVRAALDRLTPARDGVDGRSIYLYGEGWNFGEVADDALFTQAPRATSAVRASARSRTGCATPSAVAARSTRTRASRASAAASRPTPTAPRSTRAPRRPSPTTPTWWSWGSPATSRRSPSRTVPARRCAVTRWTTTGRPPATPTSRTRSSATSTPMTTRPSGTR